MARLVGMTLMLLLMAVGCATTGQLASPAAPCQRGFASYYGREFQGRPTASGEAYDASDLTGAHRTLAFGTKVRVTNVGNGHTVVVRINDRGPFRRERVIDLSAAAAQELGMLERGLARVRVDVLAR